MYNKNKIGPYVGPCGTPKFTFFPISMCYGVFFYSSLSESDCNYFRVLLLIIHFSNHASTISTSSIFAMIFVSTVITLLLCDDN